jgi:hypothetical protein
MEKESLWKMPDTFLFSPNDHNYDSKLWQASVYSIEGIRKIRA